MKKYAGLILFVAALAIFISCAKDVFVEPPPSLTGEYTGSYSIQQGQTVPTVQNINWKFSSNQYQMRRDSISDPSQDRFFCDADGNYTLENGVKLEQIFGNPTQQTCDEDLNPTGFFQLDQSTDTLRMTQYNDATQVTKTIKLLKK